MDIIGAMHATRLSMAAKKKKVRISDRCQAKTLALTFRQIAVLLFFLGLW